MGGGGGTWKIFAVYFLKSYEKRTSTESNRKQPMLARVLQPEPCRNLCTMIGGKVVVVVVVQG
jgi:hypothetical protein